MHTRIRPPQLKRVVAFYEVQAQRMPNPSPHHLVRRRVTIAGMDRMTVADRLMRKKGRRGAG